MSRAKTAPRSKSRTTPYRVVLVTGMSGAGRSTALKAFEDMGFEAVDNLPLSFLASFVQVGSQQRRHKPLAVGIDVRTRNFDAAVFAEEFEQLRQSGLAEVTTLFLDCDDDVLVRRFTETRRRHPLAGDRPIPDVLRLERRTLAPMRERAEMVVDTSLISPGELKDQLRRRFTTETSVRLAILVMSFSYRYGLPREADVVFDARFLVNPHYDPALRELSGRDAPVARAIESDTALTPFLEGMGTMLSNLLPRYEKEGKSYFTIAIGCTGGRHRSVYTAERLAERLSTEGWQVQVSHRDVARRAGQDMR